MKKIITIGPLPPPLGGATILFKQLVDDLSKEKKINSVTVNTYLLNKDNVNAGIAKRFVVVLLAVISELKHSTAISCHVSKRGFSIFAPLAVLIAKLFRKKVIVRKFGGELANTYENANFFHKVLIKFVFKADVVLLETIKQVDYFNRLFTNANIQWYPNSRPSDPDFFEFNKRVFNSNFVFVGHVKKSKGVLDAIEALIGTEFFIDIYGQIEDITLEQLNTSNSSYKGIISPSEVQNIISNYSLLLLPTFYEGEGYPGVIIEAYSVGVPVVSTRWGGIPEIVEDRLTGMLVEINNPSDIRKKIHEIASDLVFYESLCFNAFRKFESFDSKKLTKKFIDLL